MGLFNGNFSRRQVVPGEWEHLRVEKILPSTAHPNISRPQPAQPPDIPARQAYAPQRRHTRYSVEGRSIHACLYSAQLVELLNLSVSGACIRARKDLGMRGTYLLQLSDSSTIISPKCSVVWRREDLDDKGEGKGYVHGMRFQNLPTDELVRLKDFMRLWGVPDDKTVDDNHGPGALRFHIQSHEKALLTNPETLDVKKISMGGMLIGSSCMMEREGRYRIKINLARESDIRVTGRVASVIPRQEGDQQPFDVGMEFLGMEAEDRERLHRFIHSL